MPFDKMSQAEHVKVGQPGAVAKPLLPRKGVCCFGTPTCGSSCWSSRRLLRQAAGENRYMGSSAEKAYGVLKVPEPCGPPFPVLAQSQHVLPRAWRRQNSGGSRGVHEGMAECKGKRVGRGSFPAPLRMFKPQSISVLHLCSQWLFLGRTQGNPCLGISPLPSCFCPVPAARGMGGSTTGVSNLLFFISVEMSAPHVSCENCCMALAGSYF